MTQTLMNLILQLSFLLSKLLSFGWYKVSTQSCNKFICVLMWCSEFWERRDLWSLGHSIVNMWISPFPWQWLIAGPGMDIYIYIYIYQLVFQCWHRDGHIHVYIHTSLFFSAGAGMNIVTCVYIYIPACFLVLAQGLYWVTTSFIFLPTAHLLKLLN